jgi:hypothetical protein
MKNGESFRTRRFLFVIHWTLMVSDVALSAMNRPSGAQPKPSIARYTT